MRYDLIIAGGGLVGAGLAIALRESDLRVALIEAKPPHQDDPRLFALNTSSCQFLKNVSLWERLASHASPIHQVHVSHQGHFGAVRLHGSDAGLPELGHVVPAYVIESALNEELTRLPHCTLYRPGQVKTLQQDDAMAQLAVQTSAGEKMLESPLVIAADGTDSTIRSQLNIPTDIFDYGQSALVTRTCLNRFHHYVAYERFTKYGAIAMLPLSDNECATIWSADNAFVSYLMSLSDQAFLAELQKEFGYRLGRLQAVGKRHSFPLRKVKARKTLEKCVYLLGNSAQTLHPVAAQGFNLAIYEMAKLAEEIIRNTRQQKQCGPANLQQVILQTQKQKAASIGISHQLIKIFSHESFLAQALIQTGMIGLDITPPLKKRFMSGLLGKMGSVPHLLM